VIGGGSLNRLKDVLYSILGLFRDDKNNPDIDTSGSYGNNPENERSIEHGFRHSKASAVPWDRARFDEGPNVAASAPASTPLPNQYGYNDQIQERQVGGRGAEHAFYQRTPSADPTRMTPAAALEAIDAATKDDAFGKRYVKGERDAVDDLHALHRAAYPEPEAVVGPGVRSDLADEVSADWLMPTREMSPARRALEAAKSDSGFVTLYLGGDREAFAHMQSLIRAAYPEPEATGASGASAEGLAPWSGDSLSTRAGHAEGEPAVGGGFPDWRDELPRRWRV
jgi:hypothetical protein